MSIVKIVILIVAVLLAAIIGYFLGKDRLRPTGEILYTLYNDEDGKERVKCTFKLDLDVDEIINENYILLQVEKNSEVLEYYRKINSSIDGREGS